MNVQKNNLKCRLLAGIHKVREPESLFTQASVRVADYFNLNNCPPPSEWFARVEAAVIVHLKPALFVEFVNAKGSISAFKQEYSESEFQSILHKLFLCFSDDVNLPLKHRGTTARLIAKFVCEIRKSDVTEHVFYMLGLREKQCDQFNKARNDQLHHVDVENSLCTTFNWRMLSMYHQRDVFDDSYEDLLCVPMCDKFRLGQHLVMKQKVFVRANSKDRQKTEPELYITLNEKYSEMNEIVKIYAVVHAVNTARLKLRHQSALFFSLYLIFETGFLTNKSVSKCKAYVLRSLVESLASFNCPYDFAIGMLDAFQRSVQFPSDYCLFVLAKQYFLAAAGFVSEENNLFEQCFRESVFLKKSIHMKDFLANHVRSVLFHCQNQLLEIWCFVNDYNHTTCPRKCKVKGSHRRKYKDSFDYRNKKINCVKNWLNRLHEILAHFTEGGPCILSSTVQFVRQSSYRRKFLMATLFMLDLSYSKSEMVFENLLNLPCSNSRLYKCLIHAQLDKFDSTLRAKHLSSFQNTLENYTSKFHRVTDSKYPLAVADLNFEFLTFLVCFNFNEKEPLLIKQLLNDTLSIYQKISVVHRHPRVLLLERLALILSDLPMPSCQPELVIGMCKAQTKKNLLKVSKLERANENVSVTELIHFHLRRDGDYLKNILAFGFESVACNLGT